jgi:predicted transcriptional regulator of viral defense system
MDTEHKNITNLSSKLLTKLGAEGKAWFTINQTYNLRPELAKKSVSQQIMLMINEGLLMRLREGVYYIIHFEQDSASFMPDWHLLAEPLTRGGEYYIGYYSALQIHQLITQPSLKEQIVVRKRIKPVETVIKGVKFQFICPNDKHFFGSQKFRADSTKIGHHTDWNKERETPYCKRYVSYPFFKAGKHYYRGKYPTAAYSRLSAFIQNYSRHNARQGLPTLVATHSKT